MEAIITTLVLSLLLSQSSGSDKKTDRDYDELTGAVWIVRVESEDVQESKKGARAFEKLVTYDASGRKTEEIYSLRTDCVGSRHVFSYDDRGNRTQAVHWNSPDKSGASQAIPLPLIFKQVFKLDGAGRRSEVGESDYNGKFSRKTLYKYDGNGNIQEIKVEGESTQWRCEFKYNDKGLASEKTCQDSNPWNWRDSSEYAYEYDASGNWIKRIAKTSNILPNGSKRESTRITYREIKYHSSAPAPAHQKEAGDRFDMAKFPPCPPMIIRKSGAVLQGSATKRVEPRYPPEALAARVSGSVVVEVTVDEAGNVIAARSISGPSELRDASVEAAKGWKFRPTMLSMVPVKVIGTITFHYNL